jgi:hypothetical protein
LRGSEVWFDVTGYLEGVRNGATDNGVAIKSLRDDDGWQVYLNGMEDTSLRPRLVVASSTANVSAGLEGDFNDDGIVDLGDYTVWRDNLGGAFDLNGNGNESGGSAGIVDVADYDLWKSSFGNEANGGPLLTANAAVPEPSSMALALIGIVAAAAGSRKRFVGRR